MEHSVGNSADGAFTCFEDVPPGVLDFSRANAHRRPDCNHRRFRCKCVEKAERCEVDVSIGRPRCDECNRPWGDTTEQDAVHLWVWYRCGVIRDHGAIH